MSLQVIAQPGGAPEAVVLVSAGGLKRYLKTARLADRLLAPRGGRYDMELSYDWQCVVHCTPEFSAFWRVRAAAGVPVPSSRIFLEVLP